MATCKLLTCIFAACLASLTCSQIIPSMTYELTRHARRHEVSSVFFLGCTHRQPLPAMYLRRTNVEVRYLCNLQNTTQSWTAEALEPHIKGTDMVVLDETECYQGACAASDLASVVEHVSRNAGTKIVAVISALTNITDSLRLLVRKYPGQGDEQPSFEQFMYTQSASPARNVFEDIYIHKRWGAHGRGSGEGSSLPYTQNVRDYILRTVQELSIKSMLDTPCGGMLWMPLALQQMQPPIFYTGLDVACRVIARHHHEFRDVHNMEFFCADMCQQQLLQGYDLLFSRDALQHLPYAYTFKFLANVKASGAKYLMVGSYVKAEGPNRNIAIGGYYPINLLKPPFNCSQPLEVFDEQCRDRDKKHMLLYDVATMTCASDH